MNHTGSMSGIGQETRAFGAFRNVHEVDTAILRCVSAALCLHALPVSVHGLQTYFLQQQYSTHLFSTGSSSLYTHIPNFTSWRGPLVWWQWQERKAVGKDVFLERGSVLYLISLSGAAETAESQLGRVNEESNIRTERPRSKDFPPAVNHVSRDGGRDGVLFSSPPPPSAPSPTISETD